MITPIFSFKPYIEKDIYLKDPESSIIGRHLIVATVDLIEAEGFEALTFKKLASSIETTEATIYRYFKNKHSLLLYFTAWYWSWIDYVLTIRNTNINDPKRRLKNVIHTLVSPTENPVNAPIDIHKLYNIISEESSKSYLTKKVDNLNKNGVYKNYKNIVGKMSQILLDINPNFEYPHMLSTTVIEGIHHQKFFVKHLPSLTDTSEKEDYLIEFYYQLCLNHITKK